MIVVLTGASTAMVFVQYFLIREIRCEAVDLALLKPVHVML